ncbi:uncharacterized protein [Primulina eburnea]|uniref:uncharacterized protein n=1 Tax=Primulina eburnea TaxID=1245227 RepID=UPI003C6BF148
MTDRVPENDVIVSIADEPYAGKGNKKSGAFGLFKAAMFMIRKGPKEKAAKNYSIPDEDSNANWTKLVGSIRPLHMQESVPSPPSSVASDRTPTRPEMYEETIVPASPATPFSSASMSQYASAVSLRDLMDSSDGEEEEDPDEVFDAVCGDEMIDAKAEEFIAKFYEQIRIQNTTNPARKN